MKNTAVRVGPAGGIKGIGHPDTASAPTDATASIYHRDSPNYEKHHPLCFFP